MKIILFLCIFVSFADTIDRVDNTELAFDHPPRAERSLHPQRHELFDSCLARTIHDLHAIQDQLDSGIAHSKPAASSVESVLGEPNKWLFAFFILHNSLPRVD